MASPAVVIVPQDQPTERLIRCGKCRATAPEAEYRYGEGRMFGEHPEHRYHAACGASITRHGYGLVTEVAR